MKFFRLALGIFALSAALSTTSFAVEAVAERPLTTQTAGIPFKTDEPDGAELAFRIAAVLIVLLGGMAVVLYWLTRSRGKTFFPMKAGRRLQLADSLRLNPRTVLYVVRFDNRDILLAQAGDGVVLIDGQGIQSRILAAQLAEHSEVGAGSDPCAH